MKVPSAIILVIVKSFIFVIMRLFGFAPEIPSPKIRAKWGDGFYKDGVLVVGNLPPIYTISVQDTNSMDGLLDCRHLVLMTKDFNVEDLEVGDVVFYKKGGNANLHQLVYIGQDKEGWFAITKGVNCFFPDPFSIREKDIVSLMRGIIY